MHTTVEALDEVFWEEHAYVRLRGRSRIAEEPRQVLIEHQVFMGDIRSQDDAFEGHPIFETPKIASREGLGELARRNMTGASQLEIEAMVRQIEMRLANPVIREEMYQTMIDGLTKLYTQSSILSFFRTTTDQRNWAQYADSGRGHAFVFDFRQPWLMSCMSNMSPTWAVPHPVDYKPPDQFPPIPMVIGPQEPEAGWLDIQRALLMKSDRWQDQGEHRLFRVGIGPGFVSFPPASLRAMVLGYDVSAADEAILRGLCEQRSLPLPIYRAVLDYRAQRVNLERLA